MAKKSLGLQASRIHMKAPRSFEGVGSVGSKQATHLDSKPAAIITEPFNPTWTPKVCRIIAFYRFWAIVLPTLGCLGSPITARPDSKKSCDQVATIGSELFASILDSFSKPATSPFRLPCVGRKTQVFGCRASRVQGF